MAADGAGNLYIATPGGSRVRMVSPDGIITTIAGTGIQGFSGDGGPATSARLRSPTGIAVDGAGNLYIADPHDNRIRKVTPAGIISTVAGNGVSGFSGDGGPATSAQLSEPGDVAVDGAGNLFILDSLNNRIRKVTPDGVIATVAGNGTAGFSGDDGPATSAQLFITYFTAGLAVDSLGNLYIADTGNGAIRKVTPAGVITTVAGNGIIGFSGDGGRAESSQLFFVRGLAVDGLDNLYAADSDNNRIRKITMGLSTVFGPPPLRGDFNGDGKSDILWQHGDGSAALWLMNGSVPGGSGALLGAKTGWQVRKLGDFNADGKSDILLQHASGNTTMWLMNGLDVAGSVGLVSAATGWAVKDVGDFNGDGASDILWQHTDGSAALWLMNGTSVTGSSGLTGPASGWTVSQLGDFNGDGKTDILWRHSDGATVIWLMDGTTIIATSDTLSAPASGWRAEKLGDFNGDGKTDLIWQHSDGSAALWLMDGTTAVGANGLVGAGTGWSVNHVGDFNGDGKADLLWRHVDGSVTLLLMDGTTVNEANGLVGAGTGWSVKRIGDFSGDGKADIVWQQTNGTAVILLMNGTTVIGNDSLIGAGSGWIPTP
jgi:hypothetical protein